MFCTRYMALEMHWFDEQIYSNVQWFNSSILWLVRSEINTTMKVETVSDAWREKTGVLRSRLRRIQKQTCSHSKGPSSSYLHMTEHLQQFFLFILQHQCKKRMWNAFGRLLAQSQIQFPTYQSIKQTTIAQDCIQRVLGHVPIHEYDGNDFEGALVSLIDRLKFALRLQFATCPEHVAICVGGDGRSYSHQSHSVLLGFYLVEESSPIFTAASIGIKKANSNAVFGSRGSLRRCKAA